MVSEFSLIFEKYNKELDFIVIGSKEYENAVLNLDISERFEVLFESIKNYLKNNK